MSVLTDLAEAWDSMTWVQFGLFLAREGWTADEIEFERTLLKAIEFHPMLEEDIMKERYFTAVRIGATRPLKRIERNGIIQLYLNAANHAAFALRDL